MITKVNEYRPTSKRVTSKKKVALNSLIKKIKIYNLIRFGLLSYPQPNINKYK